VRVEFVAQRVLPRSHQESPMLSSYRSGGRADEAWRSILRPTAELDPEGGYIYALQAAAYDSGQYLYEIRIYPWHELLTQPFELGLLKRL
jgi:hypothetical protein